MLTGPIHTPLSGVVRKIVVLLHGYGASGDDLIELAHEWQHALPDTLFAAPNGPDQCDISALGYQWFGLSDFNPLNIRQGLDVATPVISAYILKLSTEYNISLSNIAVVGFSQGCMVALDLIFQLPGLAGAIGYSGAFYPPSTMKPIMNAPSVLLVHGTMDTVVPYAAMIQAQTQLQFYGVPVTAHTCQGLGHTIDTSGIQVGCDYLVRILKDTPTTS